MNSIKLCALQNGKLKCLSCTELFVGRAYTLKGALGLDVGAVKILDRSGRVLAENVGNQLSLDTPAIETLFAMRPIGYRVEVMITNTESDGTYTAGPITLMKAG